MNFELGIVIWNFIIDDFIIDFFFFLSSFTLFSVYWPNLFNHLSILISVDFLLLLAYFFPFLFLFRVNYRQDLMDFYPLLRVHNDHFFDQMVDDFRFV